MSFDHNTDYLSNKEKKSRSKLSENSFECNKGRTLLQQPHNCEITKKGWYNTAIDHKVKLHEQLKKTNLLTSRLARENIYCTNNYININTLKNEIIHNNPELYKIKLNYFIDNQYTSNLYEKYSYYLHFLIIYSKPSDVNSFLTNYYYDLCTDSSKKNTLQSINAMQMFINFPLVCHYNKNIITPLLCAMLWSNEPEMIRVLYQWGGDVSITDVHNNYYENIYDTHQYYYNHLHPFIVSRNIVLGIRNKNDFVDVIREMKYLSKEEHPDPKYKWSFPEKYIHIRLIADC